MPPSLILFLIGMLAGAEQDKPLWKSILCQPIIKAYLTSHSWTITEHIFLDNLNKQLHMFNHQKALAHELLMKLKCQSFTSNFILNASLGEVININSIYQSYKAPIQTAKWLLWTWPTLDKLSTSDNPQTQKEPTTPSWEISYSG